MFTLASTEFKQPQKLKRSDTLKATWDLLVFLILTALLTCLPGSSSKCHKTSNTLDNEEQESKKSCNNFHKHKRSFIFVKFRPSYTGLAGILNPHCTHDFFTQFIFKHPPNSNTLDDGKQKRKAKSCIISKNIKSSSIFANFILSERKHNSSIQLTLTTDPIQYYTTITTTNIPHMSWISLPFFHFSTLQTSNIIILIQYFNAAKFQKTMYNNQILQLFQYLHTSKMTR